MPAFDGFVLSSLEEPFGLVLLEAMGARLPIIAHASGGVPEVLGDTGMLLQEHSVAAFAEAIRRLYALDATARALMGARGRVRLEQVFAFSRFGEFLLQRLEQT
jgi:glycosyltransferase involved in cell wall biosynthesis